MEKEKEERLAFLETYIRHIIESKRYRCRMMWIESILILILIVIVLISIMC